MVIVAGRIGNKNGFRKAEAVDSFTLREDGVLIWQDPSGHYHSA